MLPQVLKSPFGMMRTPLQAGDESRSDSIRPPETITAGNIQHLVITPSDTAGADSEIDSVRLVFRGEHLEVRASQQPPR